MKIVVISLLKKDLGSGGGMVPYELAQHLAAQHDVVLMYPGGQTGTRDEDGLRIFTIKSAGEGDVYVPALSARDLGQIFHFLDTFDPDIVHAHSPISTCLTSQVWARMHSVPFVFTAHALPSHALDFGAFDALGALKKLLGNLLVRPSLSNFYTNCDAVIALNRFAAEDIRRFGYRGEILTIPNGRDLAQYQQQPLADQSLPGRTLAFVGYLSERKNQRYLLEVLRHLPARYQLKLIGDALPLTTAYAQQLKAFAQAHNLNVVFTGQVEHCNIPAHLSQTHVFVSASKAEVQSLVVLEALASGTPVVGLANETIDELVDEKVGCRLPKDTPPAEFAAQVERICSLPQSEYNRLCMNARERVREFDWSNTIALTIAAYASLRRAKSRPQPASKIARIRNVSLASWLFFFLTVSLSPLLYTFTKCLAALRRRKSAARGTRRAGL